MKEMSNYERLRQEMQERGIDATLIMNPVNVRWLSGFTGEDSLILVTKSHQYFITDCRYIEQASRELGEEYRFVKAAHNEVLREIDKLLDKHTTKTLGIEKEFVTIDLQRRFEESWFVRYAAVDGILRSLRVVKSQREIENMKKGAQITEAAFQHILKFIREGVTEYDILAELIYFMYRKGVRPSFAPIVASGENSALPHATATDRRLKAGDLLTLDFGVVCGGVCTDFTRTIGIGGVESELEMIYNTVKTANLAAIDAITAGMGANEIDRIARDIIAQAGFGAYYEHATGHGVGVEIHEGPRLSAYSTDILSAGMVVTIEPGIYLPGRGGVRIEDMVLVTEDGCENFYTATKDMILI